MGGILRMSKYILCALLGYFAGCFSPSYLLSRRRGFDIRTFGSGNAGATNMMLAAGLKPGLIVMALDVSKAFVVTFPLRLLLPPLCAALAGLHPDERELSRRRACRCIGCCKTARARG